MSIHRVKRSLTAGEISPLMSARTDLPRYQTGCKVMRNMYVLPQGPATRRPGTKFIADLSAHTIGMGAITDVDIIPFVFSDTQAYALILLFDGVTTRLLVGYLEGLVADPLFPAVPLQVDSVKGIHPRVLDYAQSGDVLFIVQRAISPTELIRTAHDAWAFQDTVFTDPPAAWIAADYPGKISLFDQRAVYASNVTYPQTIWASKAGDYYDFGVSAPLVADDAITFTLASGRQNKFAWMTDAGRLLIGTIGDEWTFSGSGSTPLAFNSVYARRHTEEGSSDIEPIMIGSSTLFVEFLGRAVFDFSYDYNTDSYQTNDLTLLASHLTAEHSIVDWDYQKKPYSVVWAVRDDGGLIGLTYLRNEKIVGWHRHDTDGLFKAVACTPSRVNRETDTWVIVEREIGGVNKLYLEKFAPEFKATSTGSVDAFFVDSGLTYSGPPAVVIGGLNHLEGKTVSILADGAVSPEQVVVAGAITLPVAASKVTVGLPYQSDLNPYPAAKEASAVDTGRGAMVGRTQRITNVTVLLHESMGMSIGRDENSLEKVYFRTPANPMSTAIPLFTGAKSVSFPEGYMKDATVYIRQTDPLPLTVLGVVDEIETYER